MQLKLFAQILPGVATAFVALIVGAIAIATSNELSYAGDNKFFCTQEGNTPVTKVRTSRGNETFLRWVVKDFKKFPPLQRCKMVSARFQVITITARFLLLAEIISTAIQFYVSPIAKVHLVQKKIY
jgi:Circadian oscillating protein COP23